MSMLAGKPANNLADADLIPPPEWVNQLVCGGQACRHDIGIERASVSSTFSDHFSIISSRIQNARVLGSGELADTVYRCYMKMAELLETSPAPHPVRFWNHLCHIHEPMGEGLDRYMAFNMGRFRAFSDWYSGSENFDRRVATASGVGCRGNDITIHILGADRDGIAVSNPRQVQPFLYSRQYGPKPPCFARGTILPMLDHQSILLIGGTASIRGEESMHIGNIEKQMAETFENIASLLATAAKIGNRKCELSDLTDLRVYVVDPTTRPAIETACRRYAPNIQQLQLMDADLCRRDLLVEIEGRAIIR